MAKVIIVEPVESHLVFFSRILSREGYDLKTFHNFQLLKNSLLKEFPDVLILGECLTRKQSESIIGQVIDSPSLARTKLIKIAHSKSEIEKEAYLALGADVVLKLPELTPFKLRENVRSLLNNTVVWL